MLQFWNLFNAKAYRSAYSSLRLKGCKGFIFIALLIIVGQVFIINLGDAMFNVQAIRAQDWAVIVASTAVVLALGEAVRGLKKLVFKLRNRGLISQ